MFKKHIINTVIFIFITSLFVGCGIDVQESPTGNEESLNFSEAVYSFDEESGATANSSDSLDGTIVNAQRVPGKVGNALNFDIPGASYVRIYMEMDTIVVFPEDKISISAWIKLNSLNLTSNYNIFSDAYGGLESFKLLINNGKLEFILYDYNQGTSIITSNTVFSVGEWYHIALTFDGSQSRIFINGSEDNYSSIVHSVSSVYNTLYIGSYIEPSFPGIIDEFKFSSTLKSPEDINNDYMSTK